MTLRKGQVVFGRYVVVDLLGEGGMGAVYRGRHRKLGIPVALKILTAADSAKDRRRFQAEAELMARIRHPNVVAILDAGLIAGDLPCIAMELLDGAPLGESSAIEPRPWRRAVDIGLGMLAGLAAIHDAEVLHRDLKPSNVVVCPGEPEVVKLIDFGIAHHESLEALGLTRTGRVIGTPAYMSPEQLTGAPLDRRSDVYSAGLVLWALLTGQPPFAELGERGIWTRLRKPLPSLSLAAGDESVPERLEAALAAALAIEPEERPDDARDFARRLRQCLEAPLEAPVAPRAQTATVPLTAQPEVQPAPKDDLGFPVLIAARLPPSRLAEPSERRFLAELAAPAGRGFSFGAQFWFALIGADSERRAAGRAGKLVGELIDRYGDTARVAWSLVEPGFALTGAQLTGTVPLPGALRELLEQLGS